MSEIWRNNAAVDLLKQGKKTEAFEQWVELLGETPYNPLYQLNMGGAFLSLEQTDKAIQMYKEILKTPSMDEASRWVSLFNLGVLYGVQGKVNQALGFYQRALEIRPDSKEIPINIELLLKKSKEKGKGKSDENPPKDSKSSDNSSAQSSEENSKKNKSPKDSQKLSPQNPFKGKDISKEDVERILEELKKQEQRIRGRQERKKSKGAPSSGKNW